MNLLLFFIALGFELIYILMFALTIRGPHFRFWPPPSARSWQFFVAWLLAAVVGVIFLFLGVLDFESFQFSSFWGRLPVAMSLLVLASLLGIWIYAVFPFRATMGLGNRLITRGPYRYSRNPQYISDSMSILGYMILTSSWMVWVIGILGVILNLMAPLTEEPWLEERFGDAYRAYRAETPRFFRLGRINV